MKEPKKKDEGAGVNYSHQEYMESQLDSLVPGHANGEASEAPQAARKIMGSDEEASR